MNSLYQVELAVIRLSLIKPLATSGSFRITLVEKTLEL